MWVYTFFPSGVGFFFVVVVVFCIFGLVFFFIFLFSLRSAVWMTRGGKAREVHLPLLQAMEAEMLLDSLCCVKTIQDQPQQLGGGRV